MFTDRYLGEEMPYIGYGDPSLSFMGKAASYVDEKQNGILFNFSIKNTYTTDKTIALFPANYDTLIVISAGEGHPATVSFTNTAAITAAGYPVDAVATDGVILTDGAGHDVTVTAGRNTMSFKDLIRFVQRNPLNIVKQEISASDSADLKFIISKYEVNPLVRPEESYLNTDKYLAVTNLQDKKLVIEDEVLQIDDQSLVIFNLKAGAELNWTLYVGAVQNDAAFFAAKTKTAVNNIKTLPVMNTVKAATR